MLIFDFDGTVANTSPLYKEAPVEKVDTMDYSSI